MITVCGLPRVDGSTLPDGRPLACYRPIRAVWWGTSYPTHHCPDHGVIPAHLTGQTEARNAR